MYLLVFGKERCRDSSISHGNLVTSCMNNTENRCFFVIVRDPVQCFTCQTNQFLLIISSCLLWVSLISLKHMAKNEVSWGNSIYNFSLCYWRKKSELVLKTICSHLKESASCWWSENNIQHLKKCMEKL